MTSSTVPKRWVGAVWDGLAVPLAIVALAFDPNWLTAGIDYYETSWQLAPVQVVLRGGMPYRDALTPLGPLFVYLPAWLFQCFGPSLAVHYSYMLAASIVNVLVAYAVAWAVCARPVSHALAALLILVEVHHPFWAPRWGGLRSGIALAAAGCLIGFVRRRSLRWLAAAGALAGVGFLYSTDVGMIALATTLAFEVWLHVAKPAGLPRPERRARAFLLGLAIPVLPLLAWFAARGALLPYLRMAFWEIPLYLLGVFAQAPPPTLAQAWSESPGVASFLLSDLVRIHLVGALYAGFAARVTWQTLRGEARETPAEVGASAVLVVLGAILYVLSFRAFTGPQFQVALVPLVILCAMALERRASRVARQWRALRGGSARAAIACAGSIALFALAGGYVAASQTRFYGSLLGWWRYQRFKTQLVPAYAEPVWVEQFAWEEPRCERCGLSMPVRQAREIEGVVGFLRAHTGPDEPFFAFPEHGVLYFLADRPGVSRFGAAGLALTTPAWRSELLEALKEASPRYAVRSTQLSALAKSIRMQEELLPEVGEYLRAEYQPVGRFGTLEILERRAKP